MSLQDPAVLTTDAVRQRLAVVEEACRALTSTAVAFDDSDRIFRDLAHIRTQMAETALRAAPRRGSNA
jgi:hypothetical protein